MRNMRKIDAAVLLNSKTDRRIFSVDPTDMETPAELTVEDVKEICLSINASSDRIHGLLEDIKRLEQQLAVAERRIEILSKIVAAGAEVSDEE